MKKTPKAISGITFPEIPPVPKLEFPQAFPGLKSLGEVTFSLAPLTAPVCVQIVVGNKGHEFPAQMTYGDKGEIIVRATGPSKPITLPKKRRKKR